MGIASRSVITDMGLNINLAKMLGLESTIHCPKCKKRTNGYLDDFDLECGDPNPEDGKWKLDFYCVHCDHEWTQKYQVTAKKI